MFKHKGFVLLMVTLLVASLVLGVVGCGQKTEPPKEPAKQAGEPAKQPSKKLVVGTDATYPPMEFHEKTGDKDVIVGFDIDFATALAKEMGMEVEFKDTAWDGIIPALQGGKFDMIVSSMTITDERKKTVNFSDPYFEAGQIIAVRPDNTTITKLEDLAGKRIGVQIGTTGDEMATKETKGKVQRFNTISDAFMALEQGRVDAVLNDKQVAEYYIKKGAKVKTVGPLYSKEYYGIAIKKENTELLKQVNDALKKLKDSGKYQEIYNKWFGK
ncbi:MAG: basic amino acid ABC transporter substrate-binding protein [Firmicutes bacterium]|nr:basic amino acid ABC transporter substrate-binding protein [Bacillota bacterium]